MRERQYDPRPRLRDRTTGDLLVLIVTATVCTSVILGGASLVFIELWDPSADTDSGLRTVTGIINTLIGLLAGFLAGRTGAILAETNVAAEIKTAQDKTAADDRAAHRADEAAADKEEKKADS